MKRVAPLEYCPGRFVLLHHFFEPSSYGGRSEEYSGGDHRGGDHWDLMFDTGVALLTFRWLTLPRPAVLPGSWSAERLSDHRRHYLQYEGPVSGNRGAVRRWATGEFTSDQEGWLHLLGDHLRARLLLPASQIGERLEVTVAHWELDWPDQSEAPGFRR